MKINLGAYYPSATYLHQLDARVKIIAAVMMTVLLFFASNFWTFGLLTCFLVILTLTAKLPLKFLQGLASLRMILILTLFFSIFMTPGEVILFRWAWFYATKEGLMTGIILIIRVALMIFATTVLTLTTTPLQLTSALESMLSPLKKIKLPIAEGALMVSLALRFVPTVLEESQRIVNSQKARGVTFEAGGLIKKIKGIISILIPLILSSFKRADDLSLALEARNFKIRKKRTHYRVMEMKRADYVGLLVMTAFSIAVLAINYLLS